MKENDRKDDKDKSKKLKAIKRSAERRKRAK
jgi:hypothetical protein